MGKLGEAVVVALLFAASHSAFGADAPPEDMRASDDVASVIYSDASKEEMLKNLAPYVAIGDKLEDVRARHEQDFRICLLGGPGVEDCHLKNGLQLVADPDGYIRIIRRSEKVVGDRTFPEMSISTNILEWGGYMRGYAE